VDASRAVENLLGEYCELMDLGDFAGVGELFADGVLADEHGTELARGADAVAAFYTAGTRLHDGSPRTKHLVVNSVIEVDESAGTATARSSYLVLQATEGLPLQPIITGRYRDRFARTGDRWVFSERRFLVDLVGDLSRHLTFDL
jgi:hypothetical protein